MAGKISYDELKGQHEKVFKDAKVLAEALEAFHKSSSIFYENMRWNETSCNDKEYDSLFPLVYSLEENSAIEDSALLSESIENLLKDESEDN